MPEHPSRSKPRQVLPPLPNTDLPVPPPDEHRDEVGDTHGFRSYGMDRTDGRDQTYGRDPTSGTDHAGGHDRTQGRDRTGSTKFRS